MRKQWFGDSRDYVKWACVRQEAGDVIVVLYGVMRRPDKFDDRLLDSRVKEFFNRLKDFVSLGEIFPGVFSSKTQFTKRAMLIDILSASSDESLISNPKAKCLSFSTQIPELSRKASQETSVFGFKMSGEYMHV